MFEPGGGSAALPGERKELRDAIAIIRAHIQDDIWVPSEDLVNLYLLGVHWLLVFDKVSHLYDA